MPSVETLSFWPLIGIGIIIAGFLLRLNAVLIVMVAGISSAAAAHVPLGDILEKIGKGFLDTRNLSLTLALPLMVIGLLERFGLRERAHQIILGIRRAAAGSLLICYLFLREVTAALGLTSLGGHPQMVRPLLAPMSTAAAEKTHGKLPAPVLDRIRAMAAATDNVGLFFGEDVFVAFGAVLFMHNFMADTLGQASDPVKIALWGLPTAIFAFLIHSYRLYRLERRIEAQLRQLPAAS